jgi:hypothetical protein
MLSKFKTYEFEVSSDACGMLDVSKLVKLYEDNRSNRLQEQQTLGIFGLE